MRRGALLMTILCAVVMAAPAAHAADFAITADENAAKPGVAVATNGTAHIAWNVGVPGVGEGTAGNDQLGYCQVPRGAKGCAPGTAKALGVAPGDISEAFNKVNVLLDEQRVMVFGYRCCVPDGTFLWDSNDGGATFAPPREIGDLSTEELSAGPGPFLVSGTNDVASFTRYQAMPIDEGTAGDAINTLGEGSGPVSGYDGSTGFLDSNTPIVAWSDLDNLFFRVFDPQKGTDFNVVGNWGPLQQIGKGEQPKLVSGPSGTYLFNNTGDPGGGDSSYITRQFDRAKGTFGAMTQVSEKGNGPIFGDFTGDESGGLTAAWIANGTTDPLRIRRSANGKTWLPIETVEEATNDEAFNLDVSAAPDGGGVVVYDNNGKGPIRAATFPPRAGADGGAIDQDGSGDAGCKFKVKIKEGIEALAQGGCFKKRADGSFATGSPVAINGMEMQPPGAGATTRSRDATAYAAANDSIVVDPKDNTIETKPNVVVRAGSVVLDKNGVKWDVDKEVEFPSLEKFNIKFFGFGVVGEADVKFTSKGAEIPINVALPGFLKGVRGSVKLRTSSKQGLILSNLEINAQNVAVGALLIKKLNVKYEKDSSLFAGSGTVVLPPAAGDSLKFAFAFKEGKFQSAEVQIGPGIPPLPLPLTATPPALFLDTIKLAIEAKDGVKITGGVGLSGGPSVAGARAVGIDGTLILDFPASKPWAQFEVRGAFSLVEIPLSSGYISYRTDGVIRFGGKLAFNAIVVSVSGQVDGVIIFDPLAFQVAAKAKVCVPGSCIAPFIGGPTPLQGTANLLVSSKGFGACVDVGVSIGIGKLWKEGIDLYESGCDVGKYAIAGARAAQSADGGTVTVKAGMPQVNFAVTGRDGPPSVRVNGPGGRTVASDPRSPLIPVKGEKAAIFTDATTKTTFVALGDPTGGRYTVEALEGSTPITGVRKADGTPDVSVKGSVGGARRARTLTYDVTSIPGQRVRFVERAAQVAEGLGKEVVGGGKGSVRFTPADGPKGERQIVAMVEQDGLPREEVVVAKYAAPGPVVPTRVRNLRIRRSGSGALATWGVSSGAREYYVRATLTDGRKQLFVTRKRSLRLPAIDRDMRATVTVQGRSAKGRRGPVATTKLARAGARRR